MRNESRRGEAMFMRAARTTYTEPAISAVGEGPIASMKTVDRRRVDASRVLEPGKGRREHEARAHGDVPEDEGKGERGVPLLDRRLVRDDRVPRRQEGPVPDAEGDARDDEREDVRREAEGEEAGRERARGDDEEPLPAAAAGAHPQGDRADDHR